MFHNWKTTLAGWATGALYLLNAASGQHLSWKQWLLAIAMAAAGSLAKDHSS
jgi:hypothetical protein